MALEAMLMTVSTTYGLNDVHHLRADFISEQVPAATRFKRGDGSFEVPAIPSTTATRTWETRSMVPSVFDHARGPREQPGIC